LHEGPCCNRNLVEMGVANSISQASRIIKYRYERWLRLIGKWPYPGKRGYEYYYCGRPIKDVLHEIAITNIIAGYFRDCEEVLRTKVDQMLLPDWTMVLGGVTFHGEYHSGSMNHTRFRARLAKYMGITANVLIVTPDSDQRIEAILEDVRQVGLEGVSVASLEDALGRPYDKIWRWADDDDLHQIEKP
jgi:hypothetical protein